MKRVVRAGSCPGAASLTQNGTCYQRPNPAMTPAGALESLRFGDSQPTLPGSVLAKDPQVVVANRAAGRRGKPPEKAKQAPGPEQPASGWHLYAKAGEAGPRQTRTTLRAALFFPKKFLTPARRRLAYSTGPANTAPYRTTSALRTT